MRKLILISLLSLFALAASANPVQKSEDGAASTSHGQSAVAGKDLNVSDKASDATMHGAKARTVEESKIEHALERRKLKRKVAEEHKRQNAARKAEIKRKRCKHLADRMNLADEEAKNAVGKKMDITRIRSQRATKKFVQECKN